MPIFQLSEEIIFPPPELAEENGLLAIGGDLGEERLLLAYSMGIFPWYSGGSPILWWSPDPRLVLFPKDIRVSRSLKQTIKRGIYEVTMDRAFEEVIVSCASVRRKRNGDTWITGDMIEAYVRLHNSGFAHSVESWEAGELAGGLYGVSLGGAFFGESMFARRRDASKVAFVSLVRQLAHLNVELIDCQVKTEHLMTFGARDIPRIQFLAMLRRALKMPSRRGNWTVS
ncbi:MAG TPA: leucyl/phenylalanyl-tRNA--protein transferase [Thermodesulfovibrionales bacterium]|nr:leucyl/phenylalanyl-tRNA--protein transferase [Thermodesulfovibrionales bacterium]